MKKAMDKLVNNIKFDKKYVLFSLVIIILGIITGSLFIVILNTADKNIIVEYITEFVDSIKNNDFNTINTFINTILVNYIIIIILSIIGFTYFLIPINIVILFYRAFIIGFSLGSFILTYKFKGIILSIIYIFPHLIVNIIVFALLTAFTLKLSIKMISNIIKKKEVNIRTYFNKYLSVILLFIVIITLSSLYEAFIEHYILKLVLNILF